ncbi:MAG: NINE protein [Opitutae bacterium]|nr:NINE protein [Opitutae bacterium]
MRKFLEIAFYLLYGLSLVGGVISDLLYGGLFSWAIESLLHFRLGELINVLLYGGFITWFLYLAGIAFAFLVFRKNLRWALFGLGAVFLVLLLSQLWTTFAYGFWLSFGSILSWIGGIVNFGLLIASFIVEFKDSGKTENKVRTVSQPGSVSSRIQPGTEGPELSDKDFLPVFLLCFLVGSLGVHRFFVGRMTSGIFMLLTCGGLGIWTLIDLILILVGSFADAEGRIVKYQSTQATPANSNPNLGVAKEITELASLREQGLLTEEEFNRKKRELLD